LEKLHTAKELEARKLELQAQQQRDKLREQQRQWKVRRIQKTKENQI
jgi:hypothetical protein